MSNNMSIIVRCGCGNLVELKSDMVGHQVLLDSKLTRNNFRLSSPSVELNGDLEEIKDLEEIGVQLGNIRIDCGKCGDFIEIEDYY